MKAKTLILFFSFLTLASCEEKDELLKTKMAARHSDKPPPDKFFPKLEETQKTADIADKKKTLTNNEVRDNQSLNPEDVGQKSASTKNKAVSNGSHQSNTENVPESTTKPNGRRHQGKNGGIPNVTIGDGICTNVDIRNNVTNFSMLKDCVVVEGFLQIVLIDYTTEKAFENVTLPNLREITGYLLLFRVSGLKSLANIFPNLEVIRGDNLMTDFALVIYEMPNLQEIGLKKLTKILRGGVRIEKNPALCYLQTINWEPIIVSGAENFIKNNKDVVACPGCPRHCSPGNCWTSKHCQETERPKCHEQCQWGCSGKSESDCYVCKHYRHEKKCVDKCPPDLYTYLSRRCISKDECLEVDKRGKPKGGAWRDDNDDQMDDKKSRPFNGSCVNQCPDGYEDDIDENNMTTCKACSGPCRKIRAGATIRNLANAQHFRGSNVINGALEFQMSNGNRNTMTELEESFGLVEEITGYLKIIHSFPITTLSFFKKLKVIKGENLDINNSSLIILDNPNLSNLFPDDQKIEIQNGGLFFHYNPKLCYSKIEKLGHMVGIKSFSQVEVQPESNGEKVACNIVSINIKINATSSSRTDVVWDSYEPQDGQQLLGYVLNYIETENRNITVFDSNACGNNTWQVVDVDIPNSTVRTVSKRIAGLKPYTNYAVYVKTYTSRNENSFVSPVGQSEIIFFRTNSDVPTVPTNVSSFPVGNSEILVSWGPPEFPNGPLVSYLVNGFLRDDDWPILKNRDYCAYPLAVETAPVIDQPEVTVKPPSTGFGTCCAKDESKAAEQKEFDIFCHEDMTLSNVPTGRKNFCYSQDYAGNYLNEVNFHSMAKRKADNGNLNSFSFNVSAQNNSFLVRNLWHYARYTISVAACGQQLDDGHPQCSPVRYTTARTLKRERADDVINVTVLVVNNTIVTASWDPVQNPNGATVTYVVEYTNLDVKDAKKTTECITEQRFSDRHRVHHIRNLSPGKYTLRVRSTSLAGDGDFSWGLVFEVELPEKSFIGIKIGLTLTVVAMVLMVVFCVAYKRRQDRKKQIRLIASVNPDYIETKYIIDDWEVPRENVEILEELGLGNFGMVYRGRWNGAKEVAIKTISETASQREKNEFLNEASVMKNFSTFHIIQLLGVVSLGNPPFVIMELMENGDLKTYLRKIRETHLVPDFSRIIRMAAEIADGMAYLESKKFVHRDLAARNCMVSRDLVCKIGDFGMARDIYETDYYKIGKKGLLPIRWMAPENLSDGVFTSDSDVWSYGVVMYEILTLAEIPYQGFSNEEVLNYVLRKGTLTIPKTCPENLYKIIERCFKWRPSDRPTFLEIVAELEPFLAQDFCETSFYHSAEGVEIRSLGIKRPFHNAAPIRFHLGNETARWVKDFEDNVTLLDQTRAGTSRGRIFKNSFQHFGSDANMEDVPLDR